jgi:hypothetical protein
MDLLQQAEISDDFWSDEREQLPRRTSLTDWWDMDMSSSDGEEADVSDSQASSPSHGHRDEQGHQPSLACVSCQFNIALLDSPCISPRVPTGQVVRRRLRPSLSEWWRRGCDETATENTETTSLEEFDITLLDSPRIRRRCVQVSAGASHTAMLLSDGRVCAVGNNESGQCDLPKQAGFVQVSAGGAHTVVLQGSGDAIAVGSNDHHQCDIPLRNTSAPRFVHVSAGLRHTVLLREDGHAEAVGCNDDGQCEIPELEAGVKYVQVSAGGHHTVLLRSDGQAIAVGAQGDISIPAVKQYQTWMDWAMTKPVLPDGVEYAPDCGELPVGSTKEEQTSEKMF